MPAAKRDFRIERGEDFRDRFTWKTKSTGVPIDLTGASAAWTLFDPRAPSAPPISTLGAPDIVLGGALGTVSTKFAKTLFDAYVGDLVGHRLVITLSNGDARPLLRGTINLLDSRQA
jgi:hypothetical protein